MKNIKVIGIAIAVAALLVVAHLGASWLIGQRMESATIAQLEKLKVEAPYLKVISQKNEYGLFSSTQEIMFGIDTACFDTGPVAPGAEDPAAPLKQISFGVRNVIQHGPIVFRDGVHLTLAHEQGELILPPEVQQHLKAAFGDQAILSWHGTVSFTGTHDLTLTSPTGKLVKPDMQLLWSGIQGKIKVNARTGAYEFNVLAPGLQVSGADAQNEQFQIEKIALTGQGQRGVADLNLGDAAFTIDNIKVNSPMFGASSAESFKIQATSVANGEFVDVNQVIQLNSVDVLGKKYGPITYHIALNHLHAETVAKLAKAFEKLSCVKRGEQDAALETLLQSARTHGIALLQHKPELLIKQIRAILPEGEVLANGHLTLTAFDGKLEADPAALLPALIAGLDAGFEATASQNLVRYFARQQMLDSAMRTLMTDRKESPTEKELADLSASIDQQLTEQIQGFAALNYVQIDGDKFKVVFKFQKGLPTLNGAPFQSPIPLPLPAAPVK